MKHNGRNFWKNADYGFRMSDPTKDFNLMGEPVQSNYVSFVKMKDCKKYEKNGKTFYDPKEAPSIPIIPGGTYYGYGPWKKRKSTNGTWMYDENGDMPFVHEYYQSTIYLVEDGVVYTSSMKRVNPPN